MPGTLFMTREDKVEIGRIVDGVKDGKDGTSGVTKDVLDVVSEHHLVEDLSTGLPDEAESRRSVESSEVWCSGSESLRRCRKKESKTIEKDPKVSKPPNRPIAHPKESQNRAMSKRRKDRSVECRRRPKEKKCRNMPEGTEIVVIPIIAADPAFRSRSRSRHKTMYADRQNKYQEKNEKSKRKQNHQPPHNRHPKPARRTTDV